LGNDFGAVTESTEERSPEANQEADFLRCNAAGFRL